MIIAQYNTLPTIPNRTCWSKACLWLNIIPYLPYPIVLVGVQHDWHAANDLVEQLDAVVSSCVFNISHDRRSVVEIAQSTLHGRGRFLHA